jgi:2-keto-4-pentenoate hydratase/2-oxohepta-3-ene-1,7-dioic acid hydratase in catechol pathway
MKATTTSSVPALALVLFACSGVSESALEEAGAPSQSETVSIASPAEALTFARVEGQEGRRVIAVTRYHAGRVDGVDLSAALGRPIDDPIDAFLTQGYGKLERLVAGSNPEARVTVRTRELVAPVDLRGRHVATGLNFPEHAGESGVGDGPFLFPKLAEATGPYAPVSVGRALLDYEVEISWVPLEPLSAGERPKHMGLVLCNDYTDRDLLLRAVDPWDPTSGKGFTTGKSFPGSLPIGNLFVIPRDYRAFAAKLELRLWVNGRLRQRAPVGAALWQIDELVDEIWSRRALTWDHRGAEVRLPIENERIPDRTLVMSGTPDGTIFQAITLGQKVRGVVAWIFGGWDVAMPEHVIDAYIRDARAAGIYLRPGDRVAIHVESMGAIENEVVQ